MSCQFFARVEAYLTAASSRLSSSPLRGGHAPFGLGSRRDQRMPVTISIARPGQPQDDRARGSGRRMPITKLPISGIGPISTCRGVPVAVERRRDAGDLELPRAGVEPVDAVEVAVGVGALERAADGRGSRPARRSAVDDLAGRSPPSVEPQHPVAVGADAHAGAAAVGGTVASVSKKPASSPDEQPTATTPAATIRTTPPSTNHHRARAILAAVAAGTRAGTAGRWRRGWSRSPLCPIFLVRTTSGRLGR